MKFVALLFLSRISRIFTDEDRRYRQFSGLFLCRMQEYPEKDRDDDNPTTEEGQMVASEVKVLLRHGV